MQPSKVIPLKPDAKSPLLTVPEVAALFRHEEDPRWVYRHSSGRGFLAPCARRFGRTLLFDREAVARLIGIDQTQLP